MSVVRTVMVSGTTLLVVLGCSCATSTSALRPWAARRMHCPEKEIVFAPVGGDCLNQSFTTGSPEVASESDCDLAATGCDHYMKFIHAPKGDWYEVR